MNTSSPPHWRLGFFLSLSTALLWGVLPLALKPLLGSLDAITITWYRFVGALLFVWIWLRWQGQLPPWRNLHGPALGLTLIAVAGLIGNYLCYLLSLDYIAPASAQTLIQLAPMLFLLGSVWLFRERFNRWQWGGFLLFVVGLLLFFNVRLRSFAAQSDFVPGLLWMIVAAISWAGYALAQKALLRYFSSPQILLMIYLIASVLLLPFVHVEQRLLLDAAGYGLLAFAVANTILAYGAFAEALVYWEGARVSATLAVTPLITLLASALLFWWRPHWVVIETLNVWSYAGALLVVAGSMLSALKRD